MATAASAEGMQLWLLFRNNIPQVPNKSELGLGVNAIAAIDLNGTMDIDEGSVLEINGNIVIDPVKDIVGITDPADRYKIIIKPGASITGGTQSLNLTTAGEYKWDGAAWISA
jgi:hypothetical protein